MVDLRGPVFDGSWDSETDQLVAELVDTVSPLTLDMWRENLDESIRINRGRYVSTTRADRVSATSSVLNDGGSLYGPWLESTGSRNWPVTRFHGYRSAHVAANEAQPVADEIAAERVARFVEEQNA